MIADTLACRGTLVIEDIDGTITLCLDTGKSSRPLAIFVSAATAREFTAAFNTARMVAHANGRSGI